MTMVESDAPIISNAILEAAPSLARWLTESSTTYVAVLSRDGRFATLSTALADRLGVSAGEPASVALLFANGDADVLAERIALRRAGATRGATDDLLLNFVNTRHSPFTLRCRIDVQPNCTLLFAEDADRAEDALRDELLQSNNQLAVLAREGERQRQELAAAHRELARINEKLVAALDTLETSFWHIRRDGETLPVCLECGDVEGADGTWQSVQRFLVSNGRSPFLSHGYCPPCARRAIVSMESEASQP